MFCHRFWFLVGVASVLALLPASVSARVKQASDSLIDTRTQRVLDDIPTSGLAVPPYLATKQDVYLFVTAGAAYTDVKVIGSPSASGLALARALETAVAGTPLEGQAIEWSDEDRPTARVTLGHGHLLSRTGTNAVSVDPLMAGLRRAGLKPHLFLRVPRYATSSLPPSPYVTALSRWYDAPHLAGRSPFLVRCTLPSRDIALVLGAPMAGPLVMLICMGVLVRVVSDERLPTEKRRRLSKGLTMPGLLLALMTMPILMVVLLTTSRLQAFSDLWLGSGSNSRLLLFFCLPGPLLCVPMLVWAKRRELKLLGPVPDTATLYLSPEEKAIHQRMKQWQSLTHVPVYLLVLGASFLLSHKSRYYHYAHDFGVFLAAIAAALATRPLRRKLASFTRKTVDDELTWRARQLGRDIGVRPHEVLVEESSRAAHVATISREGGRNLLISQKLKEVLTPTEMDFVLAQQLVLMKAKPSLSAAPGLLLLLPIPMLLLAGMVVMRHSGSSLIPGLALSLPSFPVLMLIEFAMMMFMIIGILLSVRAETRGAVKREQEADQAAVAVTGDIKAALSALAKMAQHAPPVTTGQTGAGVNQALSTANLLLRQTALRKLAPDVDVPLGLPPDLAQRMKEAQP